MKSLLIVLTATFLITAKAERVFPTSWVESQVSVYKVNHWAEADCNVTIESDWYEADVRVNFVDHWADADKKVYVVKEWYDASPVGCLLGSK